MNIDSSPMPELLFASMPVSCAISPGVVYSLWLTGLRKEFKMGAHTLAAKGATETVKTPPERLRASNRSAMEAFERMEGLLKQDGKEGYCGEEKERGTCAAVQPIGS